MDLFSASISRYSLPADSGGSLATLAAMLKMRGQLAWSKAMRCSSKTGLGLGQHMAQGQPGEVVPNPLPVLDVQQGRLLWPRAPAEFAHTPDWAKPLLEAALEMQPGR